MTEKTDQSIEKPAAPPTSLESVLVEEEYRSLRTEILARLGRIARLQEGLLLGTASYALPFIFSHFYVSSSSAGTAAGSPGQLLYALFLLLLPLVALAVEVICFAEQDAILRAGIYIRDTIERRYRSRPYRGWEDWLEQQDSVKRRRISDKYTNYTRWGVLSLYALASSIVGAAILSEVGLMSWTTSFFSLVFLYLLLAVPTLVFLYRKRREEFSSPFYNCLILDVDGCLVANGQEVSRPNVDALAALKSRGVYLTLATGRSKFGLAHLCRDLDREIGDRIGRGASGERYFDAWHVVNHGASIYHWRNNQEEALDWISGRALERVVRAIRDQKLRWFAVGSHYCYLDVTDRREVIRDLHERGDLPTDFNPESRRDVEKYLKIIDDPADWRWDEPVAKFLCYVRLNQEEVAERLRRAVRGLGCKVVRSTNDTVEIMSSKASKVKAVRKILEKKYSLKRMVTLVVGDHDNDVELLRWGRLRIAPSGASQKVRELRGIISLPAASDNRLVEEIAERYYSTAEGSSEAQSAG